MDVVRDMVDLAVGIFRQIGANKPDIKRGLSPIARDHQHIVLVGFYSTGFDCLCTVGQRLREFLLSGTWFNFFDDRRTAD